jgi:hypothetical protein
VPQQKQAAAGCQIAAHYACQDDHCTDDCEHAFPPIEPNKRRYATSDETNGGGRVLLVSSPCAKPETQCVRKPRCVPRTATCHTVAVLALGEEPQAGVSNSSRESGGLIGPPVFAMGES